MSSCRSQLADTISRLPCVSRKKLVIECFTVHKYDAMTSSVRVSYMQICVVEKQ